MSNEEALHDDSQRPAVAGRVDRRVRPRAWLLEGTQCVEFDRQKYHDSQEWEPLYDRAAIDAARMAGVHSVHEQTAVIVRAALELLESIDGNEPFTAEKMRAFKRVFGA